MFSRSFWRAVERMGPWEWLLIIAVICGVLWLIARWRQKRKFREFLLATPNRIIGLWEIQCAETPHEKDAVTYNFWSEFYRQAWEPGKVDMIRLMFRSYVAPLIFDENVKRKLYVEMEEYFQQRMGIMPLRENAGPRHIDLSKK